ncbi:MAG TPA: GIY-YIG nuclease family protein [Candidatus Altiarchaeales archaeon]|nr:GIY-YIG nuclease family protein [Candidatus Altiarchaeales archaeon]
MTYTVYMLKCRDGSLYTGYTNNIRRRLTEHENGRGSKYVRSRRPTQLVYAEEIVGLKEAMRREREIKKLSRKEKMEVAGKT